MDAQGEQVLNVINTSTGVGAIESALAAQSNAGVVECWEGTLEQFTPTPVVTTYPTVRVNAVLIFQDDIGSTARLYVPAPLDTLFNHAGDTVDPTAAAGIISAALGNLVAGSGNTVTVFKGGYLTKAPVKALESTDVVQMINPFTSKGELIYSTDTAGDYAALPIGSSGQVLAVSAGLPVWSSVSGVGFTTSTIYLSADVSMASANTFYDGPALSLAAGTWLLLGQVCINSALASGAITAKLWDGTTVTSSAIDDYNVNGDMTIPLSGIVTPSTTTTYKISAAANAVSSTAIKAAARLNAAGNTASYLLALKIG